MVSFSSDDTIKKYVYGNGLISIQRSETGKEPESNTYLYDIRGSVAFITDASGNVTTEYRYSTYGKHEVISGGEDSEWPLNYG